MLKNNTIDINISYRNITHYKKLGYDAYLHQPLNIKTTDLPSVSHVKIEAVCSICDNTTNINYCKYLKNVSTHGFYGCKNCFGVKLKMTKMENGINIRMDDRLKKGLDSKNTITISKSEDNYTELVYDENYHLYRNEVRRLTKKSVKILLENWDGYDYYDGEYIKDNFNLSHLDNNYPSIDHKISIYYGYSNNIKPLEISDIKNICYTKRSINSMKRDCDESDFNA